MNRTGGIGYSGGALVLSTGLAIVFIAWWRSGQSLDVENIATFRGEMLYWIAIVVSNSLGTSSGDFLADSLGLGFLASVLLLLGALVGLLALHYWTRVNGMLLFWLAFVLTRPLGANLGNVLTKEHQRGGLEWGTTWTSAALLVALIALVAYQVVDIRRHPLRPLPAPKHGRTGARQRPNGAVVSVPSDLRGVIQYSAS